MKTNTFKSTKSLGLAILILLLAKFVLLATAQLRNFVVSWFSEVTGVLDLEGIQTVNIITSFFSMALTIAFLICLICWSSRVYNNYLATRVDDNEVTSATMAVVYWFIPLVNLVMPYILLKRTMEGIDSIFISGGIERNRTTSHILLVTWWIVFILVFFILPIGGQLIQMNIDYRSMGMQEIGILYSAIWLVNVAFLFVFGILTFFLVRFFRQAEKQIGVPPPINNGFINY